MTLDRSRPVLVTGGAGFAGSYIVRDLLDHDLDVVVYDLGDMRAESRFVVGETTSVELERGSIDDWPRVLEVVLRRRPSAVVHAGGMMDAAFLDEHPTVALRTNVGGSLNLLEASRIVGGVSRFIFLSSIAVIGRKLYEPIDANHPTVSAKDGPLGAYGAAKAAVEAFCFSHSQTFGLDARVVRPSALYGFGMSWFAPNYMKNIVEPAVLGEQVQLRTGGQVPRDYTHAADVASLVRSILESPDDSDRVYYGATGGPLRTASEVCEIVRQSRARVGGRDRRRVDGRRPRGASDPRSIRRQQRPRARLAAAVQRAARRRRGLHRAVSGLPRVGRHAHANAAGPARRPRAGRL